MPNAVRLVTEHFVLETYYMYLLKFNKHLHLVSTEKTERVDERRTLLATVGITALKQDFVFVLLCFLS